MFEQTEFNLAAWIHQRLTYQNYRDDMYYMAHLSVDEVEDDLDLAMNMEPVNIPEPEANLYPVFQTTGQGTRPPDSQ